MIKIKKIKKKKKKKKKRGVAEPPPFGHPHFGQGGGRATPLAGLAGLGWPNHPRGPREWFDHPRPSHPSFFFSFFLFLFSFF
jgi:hypothetical protein